MVRPLFPFQIDAPVGRPGPVSSWAQGGRLRALRTCGRRIDRSPRHAARRSGPRAPSRTRRTSKCPLMANNGFPGHVAGTSALLPTADVRAPMSALAPISSASPPGADLPGGVAEGPFLTQSGHSLSYADQRVGTLLALTYRYRLMSSPWPVGSSRILCRRFRMNSSSANCWAE